MPSRSNRPAQVQVLAPYRTDGTSEEYGSPEYRAEVAGWFEALGLDAVWRPVHLDNVARTIGELSAPAGASIAFNLCDGIETDGFPGLSVVRMLEARGVAFTGADSAFYATSSSKLEMKRCFARAGVPCPPASPLAEVHTEPDIDALAAVIGFPCILKLDRGSNGLGLSRASVASNRLELQQQLHRLRQSGDAGSEHIRTYGLFAERYIPGREFTVLVVDDAASPSGLHVYPAVEIQYHPGTPAAERLLFRGHRDAPASYGPAGPHCVYAAAPQAVQEPVTALAYQAYRAAGGNGYARVDIRMDASGGALLVLEVNANCGLSVHEPTIMLGVDATGSSFPDLIAEILRAGWSRGAP